MARNAAQDFLHLPKTADFAATIRCFTRSSLRLFALLGDVK
jgi:hypothetical protein